MEQDTCNFKTYKKRVFLIFYVNFKEIPTKRESTQPTEKIKTKIMLQISLPKSNDH